MLTTSKKDEDVTKIRAILTMYLPVTNGEPTKLAAQKKTLKE